MPAHSKEVGKKLSPRAVGFVGANSGDIRPENIADRKVRFAEGNLHQSDVADKSKQQRPDGKSFNPSHVNSTPSLTAISYREPKERAPQVVAPASSLVRPNYEDILKRVSVVLHKHITTCEKSYKEAPPDMSESGTFHTSKMETFSEDNFISPVYVYHFARSVPLTRVGLCYGLRKLQSTYNHPSLGEVHIFLRTLFGEAQLSAECSIVCLIYVERLMEQANVPLTSKTWRPVVMCGLLLASKVWQDLSSWNIEIAQIYPQFTLQNINRLERTFCHHIKWDLYISSSLYAKYYFALRSLTEKSDFRRNYNTMVLQAPGAEQVAIRSENVKETMLHTTLSKSV
ncbi:CCNY [Symbiodinium microadriaticum]|nr:CCNY [Symbiodinium microadriaticum]